MPRSDWLNADIAPTARRLLLWMSVGALAIYFFMAEIMRASGPSGTVDGFGRALRPAPVFFRQYIDEEWAGWSAAVFDLGVLLVGLLVIAKLARPAARNGD